MNEGTFEELSYLQLGKRGFLLPIETNQICCEMRQLTCLYYRGCHQERKLRLQNINDNFKKIKSEPRELPLNDHKDNSHAKYLENCRVEIEKYKTEMRNFK